MSSLRLNIGRAKTVTLALIAILIFSIVPQVAARPDAPVSVYLTEYVNAKIEFDGISIKCIGWFVEGNITVYNNAGERISDIWVPIVLNTADYSYTSSADDAYLKIEEAPAASTVTIATTHSTSAIPQWLYDDYNDRVSLIPTRWVHITELQSGERVVLSYNATSTASTCPPISISEEMDPYKIVDGSSSTVSVNLTVTNGLPFSINFKVKKVLPPDANSTSDGWDDTVSNNPIFTSAGTPTTGATGLSPDSKVLYWTGDGSWPDGYITLASGASATISNFQVQGTPDLDEVGGSTTKIEMGRVYLYFAAPHSITGAQVPHFYATAKGALSVKKEQSTTDPNTWYINATFYDTSGLLKYEILNATVWATPDANPTSAAITGSRVSNRGAPLATLNPGEHYDFPSSPQSFTYAGVPKEWASFISVIAKDTAETNGWYNYTNSTVRELTGGKTSFWVKEMIWVVKGYLVKARKEVRANSTAGAGAYCIAVSLENDGQWITPYLEFYDLLPNNFAALDPGTEGYMNFYPYAMLAEDNGAPGDAPADVSQIVTGITGYSKMYVWKAYPIPAPQRGFLEWFPDTTTTKTVTVVMADGSTRAWTVKVVDASTIQINGTLTWTEGSEYTVGSGAAQTTFLVGLVHDGISAGNGGYVLVSAKGLYENLGMDVYNPIVVFYCVSGTGQYNLTDVYVVGVDPRNTMNSISVFQPFTVFGISRAVTNEWVFSLIAVLALFASIAIAARRE